MSEVSKLRQRLSNVNKNVIEYRMTVVEARALLIEIDNLLIKPKIELKIEPPKEVIRPVLISRIMDGGTF